MDSVDGTIAGKGFGNFVVIGEITISSLTKTVSKSKSLSLKISCKFLTVPDKSAPICT